MKLVRWGAPGAEQPGLVDDGGCIRSLVGVIDDVAGAALLPESLARLRQLDPAALPAVEPGVRLGPCVGNVGKLIGLGLNYSDHAAECGMEPPPEPVVFMKATSAICGPNDNLELPPGSEHTDWEVELAVVIGRPAKNISENDVMEHIAGYCVINDYTERHCQLHRAGQWVKGKSFDSFAPIGPWLVTRDEITDPQNLSLWLEIDGQTCQNGNTADMIFGVRHLVSYISRFMSLQPGDIIATGTPSGVGMGRKPQEYLRAGQVIRAGVVGLGEQRQRVVSAESGEAQLG
ncbi:MAG TPA: fumarylacetoacetate hydrolase family protein [Gammaproteobacteria bacterium]|nr:fumarylacetoacetate hydrolase family protein [Gammaproteobacteria bacterium]